VQDLREGTENYSVDAATNRYNSVGGDNYYYEDAGNLIEIEGYKYKYDYESRMVQVLYDSDEVIAEYAYDALGRRIEVYDVLAEAKTRYYYNNNWQVLSETDDSNTHLRSYIYGNYIDEVLVKTEDSDDIFYAHNQFYRSN